MTVDSLSMNALATQAEAYAEMGLYVLPLKPGGKEPLTANGLKDASNDIAAVAAWWEQWPEANIGLACAPSGLVVVDIDRHGDDDGFATFRALEKQHGVLPDSPVQATGGGGQHRIFRVRPGAQYPGKLGGGVDLKHHGYIVVAPSIHPSGTPYQWVRTLRRIADIPQAPAWIERQGRAPAEGHVATSGLIWGEVQDALRAIPADDRDTWLQVGMALHSTGHPAARGAWDAWSAASEKYRDADQEKTWRSFKGGGTTAATLYALAQQHGWVNPKSAAARVVQRAAAEPPVEAIPMEAYRDVPAPTVKPAPAEKGKWRANLVSAADIVPTPIRWLWPGWIAAGKLTVLAGAGGAGKTTLALGLIATLTTGGRWPDGTPCLSPRNVVIWSSEDDPADTLVPRLMAAGATLHRVHFVRAVTDENGERQPFDPATDMDLLRAEAARVGNVGMLLLDPLVSAVKGDMHRANDVRRSLQAVVDFAEVHGCAVLGISHFAKGGAGTTPADRVVGSQAFSALARTVLVAAKQEDGETRVLARAKSNISADEGGVQYFITPKTVGGGIEATTVEWGEGVDGSAREILGTVEEQGDDERTEQEDAERFLRDLLADGAVPTKGIKAESSDAGYAWATIRRAQKALGIEAYREGAGIGSKSAWFWRLPAPKVLTKTLRCSHSGSEHLRQNVSTLGDLGVSGYADVRG